MFFRSPFVMLVGIGACLYGVFSASVVSVTNSPAATASVSSLSEQVPNVWWIAGFALMIVCTLCSALRRPSTDQAN